MSLLALCIWGSAYQLERKQFCNPKSAGVYERAIAACHLNCPGLVRK